MTGQQVKDRLYEAKVTQAELAKRLGMSTQLMSQTLNSPDIKTGLLEKICVALGVGMDFFYPIASVQTNVNNFGKQHAQNINNGGNDVTQTAGADGSTIAMLVQQNAELIALLKAKEGL